MEGSQNAKFKLTFRGHMVIFNGHKCFVLSIFSRNKNDRRHSQIWVYHHAKYQQAPDGDHIPLRIRYLAKHLQLLTPRGVHNVIKSRSKSTTLFFA